jgi:uncharacterized membrane protein YfcA
VLAENLTDFVLLIAIGFSAQLVDGALGMAFGVISTSAMLTNNRSTKFSRIWD